MTDPTHDKEGHPFLHKMGGRKQLNGYIFVLLSTAYAIWDHPSFIVYAGVLAAGLGIQSATIAFEDRKKHN